MITSKEKPINHPINYVHTDLESSFLFSYSLNDIDSQIVEADDIPKITKNFREILKKEEQEKEQNVGHSAESSRQQAFKVQKTDFQHLQEEEEGLWTMDFDGAVGNDGVGIRIWVRSPLSALNKVPSSVRVFSYKMAFECSNNEAEYEALISSLKILRKLNAKMILVYGDSELVIKQVRGEYQAKHTRMRAYRNAVLDILKLFSKYTLTCVLRIQNSICWVPIILVITPLLL